MPILLLRTAASLLSVIRVISTSSISTWPFVGLSRPAIMPSSVLLPEPDGPTIETNSPLRIWKLIPLRISICSRPRGRVFVISCTSMTILRSEPGFCSFSSSKVLFICFLHLSCSFPYVSINKCQFVEESCLLRLLSVRLRLRQHHEKKMHKCCPFAKVAYIPAGEQLYFPSPLGLISPYLFFPYTYCKQMRTRMHVRFLHAHALPPGIFPTERLYVLQRW